MLVLQRKPGQEIVLFDRAAMEIKITVLRVRGEQVWLGVEAPQSIKVFRTEVLPKLNLPPTDEIDE